RAIGVGRRRIAILVAGSRPTVLAVVTEPPAATTSNSSRLDSDCSEARTASGFHTIPVTCCSFVKRMAATMGFVASTCALNAFENCTSWFGLSVIWQLLSILDNARIGKFRRLRLSAKLLVWTRPFARVAERCIKAIDGDLACPIATAPSTMAVSRLVAILQTAIDVRL